MKENDILLIIKNLNMNKAQGSDNVSIGMIQLCGKSIIKPLKHLSVSLLVLSQRTGKKATLSTPQKIKQ